MSVEKHEAVVRSKLEVLSLLAETITPPQDGLVGDFRQSVVFELGEDVVAEEPEVILLGALVEIDPVSIEPDRRELVQGGVMFVLVNVGDRCLPDTSVDLREGLLKLEGRETLVPSLQLIAETDLVPSAIPPDAHRPCLRAVRLDVRLELAIGFSPSCLRGRRVASQRS